MNTIDIQANWPVKVTFNGECMQMREPDRITITLTEREAELVNALTGQCSGGHTAAIFWKLHEAGINSAHAFDFSGFRPQTWPKGAHVRAGYAHAERIRHGYIRLTMDRDVAVTLKHLLDCLECTQELDIVWARLTQAGAILHPDDPPRFTGTIRRKKRELTTDELEVGKAYKLVDDPPYGERKWEEA